MFKLIGNGKTSQDEWKMLAATETPEGVKLPVGPVIVPLSVWQARRAELIRREYDHGWPLGVWLSANEGAEEIANDVDDFTVIAAEFDRFSDGLGYASARILRKLGYTGELLAFGDISGKIARLKHFGFDAFSPSRTNQPMPLRFAGAR
ncbi:MAG: DUF934 domain-containing protein [Burkholderiales bacterium]